MKGNWWRQKTGMRRETDPPLHTSVSPPTALRVVGYEYWKLVPIQSGIKSHLDKQGSHRCKEKVPLLSLTPEDLHPAHPLGTSFCKMVPTLLLLAPHHVTMPISIRRSPSVENSPKESGVQPLAAFTYLASSRYQSQKSVPGCPRLVNPLLTSSTSYHNPGCPQDGTSVTEQHTCPAVTALIHSSGSILGTFSLVSELVRQTCHCRLP